MTSSIGNGGGEGEGGEGAAPGSETSSAWRPGSARSTSAVRAASVGEEDEGEEEEAGGADMAEEEAVVARRFDATQKF